MINNLKSKRGISLIVLVITIIVSLILAGVAISMIAGENGILNKAINAKNTAAQKRIEEEEKLAQMKSPGKKKRDNNNENDNEEVTLINSDNGEINITSVETAKLSNFRICGNSNEINLPVVNNLPNGYTQLEYIQSTGQQYIDTGYAPNTNTEVYMKFSYTELVQTSWVSCMGCRKDRNVDGFYISSQGIVSNQNSSSAGFGTNETRIR